MTWFGQTGSRLKDPLQVLVRLLYLLTIRHSSVECIVNKVLSTSAELPTSWFEPQMILYQKEIEASLIKNKFCENDSENSMEV